MTEEREAPSNIEAEQALLGAILINNAAMDAVAKFLEPEHFYEPLHQQIYLAIQGLLSAGRAASPITIKPFIPSKEKVGKITVATYVARLAAEGVSVINAADFGQAIHDMAIRRSLVSLATDILNAAYDAPPDISPGKITYEAQGKLASLVDRAMPSRRLSMGRGYIEQMDAAYERKEVRGVPIVFPELGKVISEPCFEETNLYGILSSSGEGKTSFTLQLIYEALIKGHPVQFQSFDQNDVQLVRQMVAQQHSVEVRRQRVGDISQEEWKTCREFGRWIDAEAPFEIIQCGKENADQLVARARAFINRPRKKAVARAIKSGKVPLIVTDHIGQITPFDNRADEGTKARMIGGAMKDGARAEGYAQILLQQRNSKGMQRDNPRPIRSDLFGGEPSMAPFDAIAYVYRFLPYYEERKDVASGGKDWERIQKHFPAEVRDHGKDIVELGALKVRFGPRSNKRQLDFEGRYTRFKSTGQAFNNQQDMMDFADFTRS